MTFRDIRRSRKLLSIEEVRLLLLVIVLFAGLLALNIYLARILPGGEQFFMRWSGARAFLFEQIEPYSSTIAERTQNVAYGRQALSSEYPYVLNDPFYIVMLYIPLALFSDFAIARGLWMLLSEAALIGLLIAIVRSFEWEPPRWLFLALVVYSLFGYYSLTALGAGTPAVVIILLCFFFLAALRTFSDELAGALLFLISYQWEVTALFFLFVMVFMIANKRWRILTGFGMSLAILFAISFLTYPGWGLPYFRAVLADWYAVPNISFGHTASDWFPNVNIDIGLWTALLLGVILF
ncbi:MAG: glycosyltransferase family 87 protein, partial [Anaerolineales bacterium]|nr:glycosyltransferase family 87 protein [Anaerolineales bacterium]